MVPPWVTLPGQMLPSRHSGHGLPLARVVRGAEEAFFFIQPQQFLCCLNAPSESPPPKAIAKESPILARALVPTSLFHFPTWPSPARTLVTHMPTEVQRCSDNVICKHEVPAAAAAAASWLSHSIPYTFWGLPD